MKFFRNLVGLQDEFYNSQLMQDHLFEPILDIVIDTMPKDNLLNSACLELFEYIKKEGNRVLISHLVENYRDKLKDITYVQTFKTFIDRYDQTQGFTTLSEAAHFMDDENEAPRRADAGRGTRWESGIKDLDAAEEQYFNTSDDEDDEPVKSSASINGASPVSKPLVDYGSDEEENENNDAGILRSDSNTPDPSEAKDTDSDLVLTPTSSAPTPPERLSEKRRREEDEEDELGKLSANKRRSSTSSNSSVGSITNNLLKKKKSFNGRDGTGSAKTNKIAISLSPAIKTGGEGNTNGESED